MSRLARSVPFSWVLSLVVVLWLPALAFGFDVPGFARRVPSGHFLGISSPCSSLDEARASALLDVKGQILGSMNGQYSATEAFAVSGSPQSPHYHVSGQVAGSGSGTVIGVENRIIDQAYRMDSQGRYVYFVLVHFPASRIAEMARLSRGARITAQFVSVSDGRVAIRLSEVNGVRVVVDRVQVQVERVNRFAGTISYYVVHVSPGSASSRTIGLSEVVLQGSRSEVGFSVQELESGVSGLLMGAEFKVRCVFHGVDELGRSVSASLEFNA